MGYKPEAKAERNRLIYFKWKEKGFLNKGDRKYLMRKYDIGLTRLYQIIRATANKLV